MNQTIPLGDLVDIQGGGTPSRGVKEYWGGAIPWATVKDFKSNLLSETVESITRQGVMNSATNIIPAGSIIVPTRMAVGKAAINTVDLAINQDLKAILPRAHVDPRFLLHFLLSQATFLETRAQGATVKGIKLDLLRSLEFPNLPLKEQRRIGAILDKADAIRRKHEQVFALADDLFKSTFLDMFGDPVTNPKDWILELLGDLGELDRGRSRHRPRNDPRLLGGPYPLIQTGDVARAQRVITSHRSTYSELGLSQSKLWPKGTLCITIAANIADTAVLGFDACFPDSVVGFRPSERVTTEYIRGWFSFLQEIISDKASRSAQKNINLRILRALEIPVPPIDQQRNFSRFVEKLQISLELQRKYKTEADLIFASLSQSAFRGEL